MKTSSRLDWTITKKQQFVATNIKTGATLIARTRAILNSKINNYDNH